ncbi:MAG: CehA/McbA family metallohydrolase [Eubacterium sp.]|nr:CehA/McbA family metallohydrolase [Eubacterium sp.]
MERRWFKGDTHLHTLNSDGHLHQYELVERCKKLGLDWIIITDHNFNTVEETYSSDGLTVIQGQELTGHNGHINVWGERIPFEAPYVLDTIEDYKKITEKARKNGAVISVNHPFCSNCPFRMDINEYPMDSVEVWNTIQHSDNTRNMKWWESKLLEGKHIAAVGGSDFHRNYAGMDMLAMPTTITHSKSNSKEDILAALKEGRSVVTNRPDSSMIYLKAGEAEIGDSVSLGSGLTGECTATKLKPGFTLRIYNNDKIIYTHTARTFEKEHKAIFGIKEKGFIRAEIDYTLKGAFLKAFAALEHKIFSGFNRDMPETANELFWAFTNPIWIEK